MFSRSLRPKSRVRHVDAPDLSVIEPGTVTWLADSRGLVCLLCGGRVAMGPMDMMAEAVKLHRSNCHAS